MVIKYHYYIKAACLCVCSKYLALFLGNFWSNSKVKHILRTLHDPGSLINYFEIIFFIPHTIETIIYCYLKRIFKVYFSKHDVIRYPRVQSQEELFWQKMVLNFFNIDKIWTASLLANWWNVKCYLLSAILSPWKSLHTQYVYYHT